MKMKVYIDGLNILPDKFWDYMCDGVYRRNKDPNILKISIQDKTYIFERSAINECDGIVLVYDKDDSTTWDYLVAKQETFVGKNVVVAEFSKKKLVTTEHENGLISASFPDFEKIENSLKIQEFSIGWGEDVWNPIQHITELAHGIILPDLITELSDAYWGE